jgi:hypothetical protein
MLDQVTSKEHAGQNSFVFQMVDDLFTGKSCPFPYRVEETEPGGIGWRPSREASDKARTS